MPSPFPGMDPYLEGSLWTTVHAQLAVEIARLLAPRIRPKYIALPQERMVFDDAPGVAVERASTYPDVGVVSSTPGVPSSGSSESSAPLQLATVVPEAVPHVSVEIRDAERRTLVTAIEILSPTNKRGSGRDEYLERRRRILSSTAHLVEIDLLRVGARVPMRQPLPNAPYFVLVTRVSRRPLADVWPVRIDQPLPMVPIPLLAPDPDVMLDLQQAITAVYDGVGYDLIVDYARPPEPPLSAEDASWATARTRAWRPA